MSAWFPLTAYTGFVLGLLGGFVLAVGAVLFVATKVVASRWLMRRALKARAARAGLSCDTYSDSDGNLWIATPNGWVRVDQTDSYGD